jgi:hypothetical protein
MCKTADQLRAAWYAVATRIDPTQDQAIVLDKVAEDRSRPEYITARDRLVWHMSTCPDCQRRWENNR